MTRATLPQEIVASIADLIMARVWKPGDRIPPEKELAARFHVGRSTIREAVKSLVILGVIEARAGDGSHIRGGTSDLLSGAFQWGMMLTEQNLGDLVDIRILIEVECAGRAAAARKPDVGATLTQLTGQMSEVWNQPKEFMKKGEADARLAGALSAGTEIVFLDVLDRETFAEAGRLIWENRGERLFGTGSQGFEAALVAYWRSAGLIPAEPKVFRAPPASRIACVSGSVSPITAAQIAFAVEHAWQTPR